MAAKSSRSISAACFASTAISRPKPLSDDRSSVARPAIVPRPALAVRLSMTSFDWSNRPNALMLVRTVPLTGLSSRSASVRSDPRNCGLANVPLTSAPSAIGPDTSKLSMPVNRQIVSAGPLYLTWANSGALVRRLVRSPVRPSGEMRACACPTVLPPLAAMALTARPLPSRTRLMPASTGFDIISTPARVRPRTRRLALPVGVASPAGSR